MEYTQSDKQDIANSVQRMADVAVESFKIAKESLVYATKVSRLRVTLDTVDALRRELARFPFLSFGNLDDFEQEVATYARELAGSLMADIAGGNQKGIDAEREGNLDEALAEYEHLVEMQADTPHTYRRLATIYRKLKQPQDEIRILRAALISIPETNPQHFKWFQDRLAAVTRRSLKLDADES